MTSVAVGGWCIFGASVDGTVRRYDIRMGRAYADQLHHPVTSVALSHDGLCVLAACLDSTLRLLDRDSGELLAAYTGHVHASVKMDCALTPSDAHVIGSSESGAWKWVGVRERARRSCVGTDMRMARACSPCAPWLGVWPHPPHCMHAGRGGGARHQPPCALCTRMHRAAMPIGMQRQTRGHIMMT